MKHKSTGSPKRAVDLESTVPPEPYLIAHKVRGEPAFDIAIQLDIGTDTDPGPWWIIPTSGHRAYPFWTCPLKDLSIVYEGGLIDPTKDALAHITEVPDHYQINAAPRGTGTTTAEDLITAFGLRPTITRR